MKTEGWLPVAKLMEQNKSHFEDDMKRLVETCNKYPEIEEFVRVLINGLLSDDKSEEYRIADVLSGFLWQLNNIDIRSSLTNPHHYRGSWLYELNSFIGNYFLDDARFAIVRSEGYNDWKVISDCENGIQNPLALIAAAKDVANFYCKLNGLEGKAWMRCMRKGMESSGEVERYLQRNDRGEE